MLKLSFRGYAVLALFTLLLSVGTSSASSFPYYDDPFSTPGGTCCSFAGNNATAHIVVTNSGAAHDILFGVVAFQDSNGDLSWNQSLHGWSGNVGGTTLLITTNLPIFLSWSGVADAGGVNQESYTVFGQTVIGPNTYPVIDLGNVATGTANFDLTFTSTWGDGRTGSLRSFFFWEETIAPNPTFVPEPSSLLMLGSGVIACIPPMRKKLRR
jgi:PEP-CTERM motif